MKMYMNECMIRYVAIRYKGQELVKSHILYANINHVVST